MTPLSLDSRRREAVLFHQAVAAHRRLSLLSEISSALAVSRDVESSLACVARLAAERLGDWCVAELRDRDGGPPRLVACAARDPKLEAQVREKRPRCLQTRAPIISDGVPVGTLIVGRRRGAFTTPDRELVFELGRRAGVAVANTRLGEERRRADELLGQALAANRMVAWSWEAGSSVVERSANAAEVYGADPGSTFDGAVKLLHPDDKAAYLKQVARAVEKRTSFVACFRMVRADGTVVWMEEHVSAQATPSGLRLQGVVLDVTARKTAEDELTLQAAVSRILSDSGDAAEAFPRLVEAIGAGLGFTYGFGWIAEDAGRYLTIHGAWRRRGTTASGFTRLASRPPAAVGDGLVGAVWKHGRPASVCSPSDQAGDPLACAFVFPVLGPRGTVGVFEFYGDGVAVSQERRDALFESLGRQIGHFLDRRRAHAELDRQRREQQQILDAVPAMIWYKDDCNVVLRVNKAAADWCGRAPEELEGRSASELFPERGTEYHEDDLKVIRSGQATLGLIEHAVSPTGRRAWIRRDIVPWRDDLGRAVGVVIFAVDITEIKRAEQILRDSEQAQRDFVANVSHEFRTPVAAIKGFAETLRKGGLEDKQNRLSFVRTIESHADRLDWLVQDLLNLAKLGSGMVQMKTEPIVLKPFLERYAETVSSLLERRKARLELDIPDSLAARGDAPHTVQVLDNLISNALKYSPQGGVVRVKAREIRGRVRVSVSDEGIGIAAEHLPRLFDRFFRVAKGDGRGSTGLGLHIVKTIVEAQKGKVWAESEPGKGSTFHFTLPRA